MERAVARIEFDAIRANCARLKAELGDSELCAVVKADGYGHGADACAGAAVAGGATWLAVATAVEAEAVGRRYRHVPLLTLGALTAEEVDIVLSASSELSIWREDFRALVAARASAQGARARVHVKYDSGMGRLGNPDPDEVLALARACDADPQLELAGVWTHFATADEPESDFFDEQLDRFEGDPRERGLVPALSLRSYVADVKRFPAGASAGYGQRWHAPADTWVGVIPLGYGDGLRRALTNNAEVLVGGRRYPLVGTVSMDNVTIDLGPETAVAPGAEAVLIGPQGSERILAEEVAQRLG